MASRRLARALVAAIPRVGRSLRSSPSLTYTQHIPAKTPLPAVSSFHTSCARFNEHVFNIQDPDDFAKRVVNSSTPVVIDFHATWCGPCKLLGPRLESLIAAREGKVVLAKIDIDDLQELAIDHGVEAVPTVLAMKDGKVVDRFVGLKDDADLHSFLDKLSG